MKQDSEPTLTEIEKRYPNEWVLVEETAWNKQGNPVRRIMRTHSLRRKDVAAFLKEGHFQVSFPVAVKADVGDRRSVRSQG